VAKNTHPHFTTGEPCSCGFTRHLSKTASARTSSKLQWIQERPDKFKTQQPEKAQGALDALGRLIGYVPQADDLVPWLWREIKKGRIEAEIGTGGYRLYLPDEPITPDLLGHWADWFNSNSPTRRGVDIMQLKTPDFLDRIGQWDEEMRKKMEEAEGTSGGQIVHKFDDGWTVRRVRPDEARDEGDQMGHCVGGYADDIANGSCQIFSLRDPRNRPHSTAEVQPDGGRNGGYGSGGVSGNYDLNDYYGVTPWGGESKGGYVVPEHVWESPALQGCPHGQAQGPSSRAPG
jgi:hypothetical protein